MPLPALDTYLSFFPASSFPKDTYIANYTQIISREFQNSSDWFEIEEETYNGSEIFEKKIVRINQVINSLTGEKGEDDFKLLIFKPGETTSIGRYYKFNNNYWLVITTDKIKSISTSATVRRCNNILRWIDKNGSIHSAPIAYGDYLLRENRDYATAGSALVQPSGSLDVYTQFNWRTNTIEANQRFLLGNRNNWTAYKLFGGGINNLNRTETESEFSAGLIRFNLGTNYINPETDDLERGIADINQLSYSVSFPENEISGYIGASFVLNPIVKLNGQTIENENITWEIENPLIAKISNDVITLLTIGTTKLHVQIKDNPYSKVTLNVVVTSNPVMEKYITITPNQNYLLERTESEFTVTLKQGETSLPNSFTFTNVTVDVPPENYIFATTGINTFNVENIKKSTGTVLIKAVSGTYEKTFEIKLKGAW